MRKGSPRPSLGRETREGPGTWGTALDLFGVPPVASETYSGPISSLRRVSDFTPDIAAPFTRVVNGEGNQTCSPRTIASRSLGPGRARSLERTHHTAVPALVPTSASPASCTSPQHRWTGRQGRTLVPPKTEDSSRPPRSHVHLSRRHVARVLHVLLRHRLLRHGKGNQTCSPCTITRWRCFRSTGDSDVPMVGWPRTREAKGIGWTPPCALAQAEQRGDSERPSA